MYRSRIRKNSLLENSPIFEGNKLIAVLLTTLRVAMIENSPILPTGIDRQVKVNKKKKHPATSKARCFFADKSTIHMEKWHHKEGQKSRSADTNQVSAGLFVRLSAQLTRPATLHSEFPKAREYNRICIDRPLKTRGDCQCLLKTMYTKRK